MVEINLAYASETAIRVEFFGDEVDRISEVNPLTGEKKASIRHVAIFLPAIILSRTKRRPRGLRRIRMEMDAQVERFRAEGKLIEAQRIAQRTNYDVEMLQEVGTCKGGKTIPQCWLAARRGLPPTTLLDYFPGRFSSFFCGREPCNAATASGYVWRRILRARKALGLWLPPALCL